MNLNQPCCISQITISAYEETKYPEFIESLFDLQIKCAKDMNRKFTKQEANIFISKSTLARFIFVFFSLILANFKKIDVTEAGDGKDVRGVRDSEKVMGLMDYRF